MIDNVSFPFTFLKKYNYCTQIFKSIAKFRNPNPQSESENPQSESENPQQAKIPKIRNPLKIRIFVRIRIRSKKSTDCIPTLTTYYKRRFKFIIFNIINKNIKNYYLCDSISNTYNIAKIIILCNWRKKCISCLYINIGKLIYSIQILFNSCANLLFKVKTSNSSYFDIV